MNNILIVGGDSYIGGALKSFWTDKKFSVDSTSRKTEQLDKIFFDLQNLDFSTFSSNYSFIVFLAGITNIQYCIDHPDLSEQINVEKTIEALTFFEKLSPNILFISSADVFDGSQPRKSIYSKQSPRNLYGKQKNLVEKFIIEELTNTSILRLSKVVDKDLPLFRKWQDEISAGSSIFLYDNKFFSPTSMEIVIDKINSIRQNNHSRLYHCHGDDDISYFDYAIKYLKFDKNLVIPSHDPSGTEKNYFSSLQDDHLN
jgi:dTDP-4-dehydrorhamnose reductase